MRRRLGSEPEHFRAPFMFEKLPSLHEFHPEWYTGGPTASYLPLTYDLVSLTKPSSVVTLGFGEGQIHFAFCQAAREARLTTRCLALRRDVEENQDDEDAWVRGLESGNELYGETSELVSEPWTNFASRLTARGVDKVDILFIDEIDSGAELERLLSSYEPVLSRDGLVLFHGISLQRSDAPGTVWDKWTASRHAVRFSAGLGLGVATVGPKTKPIGPQYDWLFPQERASSLGYLYLLAAERTEAQKLATKATREVASLRARQVWIDSILADRREAQRVMDEQARMIGDLQPRVEAWQRDRESLQRDRAKAQFVMDTQLEQLQRCETERNKYKLQATEQKQILKIAREACRKKGRCFQLPNEKAAKKQRPISERILREIKRVPGNLLGRKATPPAVAKADSRNKARKQDTWGSANAHERYAAWIAQYEPDKAGLEAQRRENTQWPNAPTISLLLPVHNTPAKFLEEMIASVRAQTYANWQLCMVDGGSTDAGTLAVLEQQRAASDPRINITRLPANLGIAENTNRALELATGDFFACVDHDDLLAPFALHEVARTIMAFPESDVFYSDEDRLGVNEQRHSPFFKPEWSPELLLSCMYLGHLTAYRRGLVDQVGSFRKEFDLSQDYDFALRATEKARAICHIPRVLYHWREHPGSGSAGGKPQARATNLAALGAAMQRRGLDAEIIELPTANRARLKLAGTPRVSLVIPTDSEERARACLEQLPQMTNYPDYEIILVTNSRLADSIESVAAPLARLVRYDKPFNFSEKCNRGAEVATGARLIFFNDDVESGQSDWIQNLIEPLENPEIGAVAPKLLYTTGNIQHAGLVTGVRGLVGTACHQWPADSSDHTNFAQSFRDVSALSGACLAVRTDDFRRVGEFNAVETPILHSDIDLCFSLRAAGLRCVYTPFATLRHVGHASLGAEEEKAEAPAKPDKSVIYLLKRWGGDATHDPFFTDNMRDWLYADSPTPIRMFARNRAEAKSQLDLLFVSHDLSRSGAPILLLHLARWCLAHGFFVTVMAPEDGPLRAAYQTEGIPLIIDPLIMKGHESFQDFLRPYDALLANTIRGWPAVRAAKKQGVPALWWMHETLVGEHYLREDVNLRLSVREADVIFTPSAATAAVYRPFTEHTPRCIPYGIPDLLPSGENAIARQDGELRFLLLGSIEPRKGQDVYTEALRLLPQALQKRAQFQIAGRVMDPSFAVEVYALGRDVENLQISGETDHAEALALLADADVLVCASRDEAMPVTVLEAMSLGKAILSTAVGGLPEYIRHGKNGLLVKPEEPAELAAAIERLIENPSEARLLGQQARATFEEQFEMDRFGENFIGLVRELVAEPAGV